MTEAKMTSRNLESWWHFIVQTYLVGGLPLVAIGAGSFVIFTPGISTERFTLSLILIIGGFLSWGITTVIVYLRWRKIYHSQVYREDRRMADLVDLTKLFVNKSESVDSGTMNNFAPFMEKVAGALIRVMETPYATPGPQPGELPARARVSDARLESPGSP